jgi:hypothetical protein
MTFRKAFGASSIAIRPVSVKTCVLYKTNFYLHMNQQVMSLISECEMTSFHLEGFAAPQHPIISQCGMTIP